MSELTRSHRLEVCPAAGPEPRDNAAVIAEGVGVLGETRVNNSVLAPLPAAAVLCKPTARMKHIKKTHKKTSVPPVQLSWMCKLAIETKNAFSAVKLGVLTWALTGTDSLLEPRVAI